jgi:PleD family two-component response regulator
MHGSIWVESFKQTGSTFFFTVELHRTAPPEKLTIPLPKLSPQSHSKSILLAEDSAINRKVLNKILTDYGYKCTCVSDGLEVHLFFSTYK